MAEAAARTIQAHERWTPAEIKSAIQEHLWNDLRLEGRPNAGSRKERDHPLCRGHEQFGVMGSPSDTKQLPGKHFEVEGDSLRSPNQDILQTAGTGIRGELCPQPNGSGLAAGDLRRDDAPGGALSHPSRSEPQEPGGYVNEEEKHLNKIDDEEFHECSEGNDARPGFKDEGDQDAGNHDDFLDDYVSFERNRDMSCGGRR